MVKIFIIFTLATSLLTVNAQSQESANNIAKFDYDILLEGDNTGIMSMTISQFSNNEYSILTNSDIKLSGWWGKHLVHSNMVEQFSNSGRLLKADNMILDGKKAYWTKMILANDELWASSVQVKSVKEHEEEEFIGMIANIGSMFVSGAGDVLAVSNLLFAGAESSHNNIRLSQDSYDTSFNNLPFYWLKYNKSLPAKINILDSDNLSIYTMKTKLIKVENNNQGLIDSSVYHYILTAKKGKPLHMWLTINDNNIPYFTRLTGADKDGHFQINLK